MQRNEKTEARRQMRDEMREERSEKTEFGRSAVQMASWGYRLGRPSRRLGVEQEHGLAVTGATGDGLRCE